MTLSKSKWILFLFMSLYLCSCHSSRFIGDNDVLYTGATVTIKNKKGIRDVKRIQQEVNTITRPNPNSKLFGFYFGLWAQQYGSREKAGRIAKYFKRRYGEEPVVLSTVDTAVNIRLIYNRLENRGIFNTTIHAEIHQRRQKANIKYIVDNQNTYTLKEYIYNEDTSEISQLVAISVGRSQLVEGSRYDLDSLKSERVRISNYLRSKGYFNFRPDYLLFKVDTNLVEDHKFNLYVTLKRGIPEDAMVPYEIESVTVHTNYSLRGASEGGDTSYFEGIKFIDRGPSVRHDRLSEFLVLEPGTMFNGRLQSLSTSRLNSTGNFRFVNIRLLPNPIDTIDSIKTLSAHVFLTPLKRRSLRAELQGLSKSNNFVGPLGLINYRNRNIFKGAEMLQLTGKLGFETQFASGELTGLNSYEVGLEAAIIIPRLVLPFDYRRKKLPTVPNTKIAMNYSILNRVQFYQLNSFLLTYGYRWRANQFVTHEVHPISINFVDLSSTSDAFEEILNNNPVLRRSFQEQFILGLNYSFLYSELGWSKDVSERLFFLTNIDFSGNALKGVQTLFEGPGEKTIFNQVYAQYSKMDSDIRYYIDLQKDRRLVLRAFGGAGISYGNSNSLPFIKQYFSGGPNSLRAFRIRSMGPGTYQPEMAGIAAFFDQSGDIKLEANVEYRFPIAGFFKGAFFLDAGNIWLLRENEVLPGSGISSSWWRELAIGTGFGLRFDLNFFVIRLDVGTPLRKPFLPQGQRWLSEFNIGQREWRRENIIWNLAFGYPF